MNNTFIFVRAVMAGLAAVATLAGLAGIGKSISKEKGPTSSQPQSVPSSKLAQPLYNQQHYAQARKTERELQERNFLRTHGGNVVSGNTKRLDTLHKGPFYSELADVNMSYEQFRHNNMQPFMSAKNTQDMRLDRDLRTLEAYTGVNKLHRDKQEVPAMFEPTPGMTYVNGTPVTTSFQQSRMEGQVSQRNNELPFQQVKVGKGLGLGYSAEPGGGFNQCPTAEMMGYKTVDELRTANNPKTSYSFPLQAGMGVPQRGLLPNVAKNRFERTHENDCPLPTAAPGTCMQASRAEVVTRETGRGLGEHVYIPPAAISGAPQGKLTQEHVPLRRRDDGTTVAGPTNEHFAAYGAGLSDDYGLERIDLQPTAREYLVAVPPRPGNITSVAKAFIMPVLDMLRITRKDATVQGHRDFGPMQMQAPSKLTVKPQDVPLPTIKDTNLHESQRLNLKGPTRATVVDVTQTPRTTIKETLIHDTHVGNFGNGPRCVAVYDAAFTRKTGRETLPSKEYVLNMRGQDRGVIRTNDQQARVTVRETTILEDYIGHVRVSNGMKYDPTQSHEMKATNREFTSQHERYGGGAGYNHTGAYEGVQFDMKTTNRELQDGGHFGCAAPGEARAQMSYEAFEAAETNEMRELTLERGPPVPTGQSVTAGVESVHMTRERDQVLVDGHDDVADRVMQVPLGKEAIQMTSERQAYAQDDRILAELVDQVRSNPYVLPPMAEAARSVET